MDDDDQSDVLAQQVQTAANDTDVQVLQDTVDVNSSPPLELPLPVAPPVVVQNPVQNPVTVQVSFGRASAQDPLVQTNLSHP